MAEPVPDACGLRVTADLQPKGKLLLLLPQLPSHSLGHAAAVSPSPAPPAGQPVPCPPPPVLPAWLAGAGRTRTVWTGAPAAGHGDTTTVQVQRN